MARPSARALAERLLARRGLEIRRAGKGPRRTLGEVLAHLSGLGLRPGAVIDVGVGYGTQELYAPFPAARHLLVEPLREYEPQIAPLAARIGAEVVYAAAGAEAGEATIHVHRAPTLSSVHDGGRGDRSATTARIVPVVRVDELVRERGLPRPYVLKVDVEGAELEVVAGAEEILEQTEVVLLETSLFRHLGVVDRGAVSPAELYAYRELLTRLDGGRAFLRIMRGFELTEQKRRFLWEGLAERSYPARVVWGERDPALGLEQLRTVQRVLGVEDPVLLPAKHFLQEDQAQAIAYAIADLVAPLG